MSMLNESSWEFRAHLLTTGTRWSWTRFDHAGSVIDSQLTFPSYKDALAHACSFGFKSGQHRFVLSALEAKIPPHRHEFELLPCWPLGVAVV